MLIAQNFNEIQNASGIVGTNSTLGAIISKPLPFVFSAAGIALLVYLVLGGLQIMTSKGDPKAMQGAQGKITNAIIGFVIVIMAFFIVQLIGQIFGIEAFSSIFGRGGGTSGISK